MHIFNTITDLRNYLNSQNNSRKSIGFVPTMGALHDGHLKLVSESMNENELTIVSIFVNPTQFNNPDDLKKYPRTLEKDISLLKKIGCTALFCPSNDEVYPKNYSPLHIDLSPLDEVMEGKHRPGHFNGVVNVVHRLFDIVQPTKAYFGKKDFQQVAVIRAMKEALNLSVEVVAIETLRESNGLAMSSRNLRLSESEKEKSTVIYKSLVKAKELATEKGPKEVEKTLTQLIEEGGLNVEYVSIVHPESLMPMEKWEKGATACVVAYCGDVRLLDNMEVYN